MRDVLRYLCHLCRHFGCGVARFADDGFWEIYCPVCDQVMLRYDLPEDET